MSSAVPNSRTVPLQPRSIVPATRSNGDGNSRTSTVAQQGGTTTTAALRLKSKALSPPSPALSNNSDLDDDDTPLSNYNNNLSPSLSYSAYSPQSPNSRTPPLTPSPPTNELSVFTSGYSDSPSYTSLASVRQAILTRLPAKNESGKAFTMTAKEGIKAQKMTLVNGKVNGHENVDGRGGDIKVSDEEGTESSSTSFESLESETKGDKLAEESVIDNLRVPQATKVAAGKVENVRLSTASLESDTSVDWKGDLDDVGKDASNVDFDSRMMSFLGPRTRKLSKAPWEGMTSPITIDETSEDNRKDSTSSFNRTSKDTAAEGPKPKQTLRSRTKSFGALTSRKVPAVVISRDSVDGLQGLGIDGKNGHGSLPSSPTKLSRGSKSVKDSLASPRDSGDSTRGPWSPVMIRKSSEVGAFSFPPPPLPPLPPQPASPSTSRFQKLQQRLGREVTPLVFDIVPSGAPSAPPTKAIPRSAPANIQNFDLPRPTSGASSNGNARAVATSSSRSLHSLSPTSPNFPLSSPTLTTPRSTSPTTRADGTALTTPLATGYKLISLEQAREREMERVALAAQQRKAMAPVEHIAPRVETAPTPLQAPLPIEAVGREGNASSSASSAGVKTLKTKKSGFLKRMMGGDKTSVPTTPTLPQNSPSVTVLPETLRTISGTESLAAVPSNSPSPPSVSITVSSPPPTAALPAVPSVTLSAPSPLSPSTSALKLDSKGNLIAPSLSLRPVSMGFLAGLPTNFLASPPRAKAQTIYEAPAPQPPRTPSPVVAPSVLRSTQLPSSSTLDSNSSSVFASTTTTPVTPSNSYTSTIATNGKSPSPPYDPKTIPASAYYSHADNETLGEVKEQFERAKMVWKSIRRDLENQVKELKSEVVRLRDGEDAAIEYDTPCTRCELHLEECQCSVEPISILSRPRFKGNRGTKSLFSA